MNLIALDDRMLFFIATVANIKVEISYIISAPRIDCPQALLKFLIANAMEASEKIIILKTVLLFTRGHVVTMVMCSTTFINFLVTAKIIIATRGISRTTPFCAF